MTFSSGGAGTIDNAMITYATIGVYLLGTGPMTLSNVTARLNDYGLYVYNTNSTVNASGCSFTENTFYGVYTGSSSYNYAPALTITNSSIHSNLGSHDYYSYRYKDAGTTSLDATSNWWGTTDEATIRSRVYDHADFVNSPMVDWCGYLDGPAGSPYPQGSYCSVGLICNETVIWDQTDQPYLLITDVVVCPTGTLQIEAGVEVRSLPHAGLGIEVQGLLDVNGAVGSEVTFTSDAIAPAAGDWRGLSFSSSGIGSIDNAAISYAVDGVYAEGSSHVTLSGVGITYGSGNGVYANGAAATVDLSGVATSQCGNGVYANGATVTLAGVTATQNTYGVYLVGGATGTLTDVTTTENTIGVYLLGTGPVTLSNVTARLNDYGLYVYNTNSTVNASDCSFTENNVYGVFAGSSSYNYAPALTITNSSIHSNLGSHDYYSYRYKDAGTTSLDATSNWWGTTDEATIRSRVYDHADFVNSPMVDWCGYLDGPAGSPYPQGSYCSVGLICNETVIWDQTDQPYLLITDVVVCPTGTLQIEAGVEVRSLPHAGLGIEVEGLLDVNGAVGSEVTFTSDAIAPAAGDWRGLSFSSSGIGSIDNAAISYAVDGVYAEGSSHLTLSGVGITYGSGNGVYANGAAATVDLSGVATSQCGNGVYANGATVTLAGVTATQSTYGVYLVGGATGTLTDVTTTENTIGVYLLGTGPVTLSNVTARLNDYGLYVYNTNSTVNASDCSFTENNVYGVFAGSSSYNYAPALTITNSSIHSNLGSHDYYSYRYKDAGTTSLDATSNWWGTTDEATIRSRVYDHADFVNSPMVDWCGYLDGPAGSPYPQGSYCSVGLICNETVIWDQTDQPYLLITDVVVCPTGTLQIEAGVEVRSLPHAGLGIEVQGLLDVNGAVGSEVTFTSDAIAPAAGDWRGLSFSSSGIGSIDNAAISYAVDGVYAEGSSHLTLSGVGITYGSGNGVYANGAAATVDLSGVATSQCGNGVYANGATVTLAGVTATQSTYGVYLVGGATGTLTGVTTTENTIGVYLLGAGPMTLSNVTARLNDYGLDVYNSNSTVNASGCSFTENNVNGVFAGSSSYNYAPALTITNSSIHSNLGSHDYYSYRYKDAGTTILWAPDNWWGTMDHDQIGARIYDRDEDSSSPRVWFKPFGDDCESVLAKDQDGDGLADFEDNCPLHVNADQTDADSDGMGDPCDPEPGAVPVADCDGFNDVIEGYVDTDSDNWGDPCDFQPTRSDSYPGATEVCDGRDNDGDGLFGIGELSDADFDQALTCTDCDDAEPEVYPCACERCINLVDDDCDNFVDGADSDCVEHPYCILVTSAAPEPDLDLGKGACGGAGISGPFEVIRGSMAELQSVGGHVELGDVSCVDPALSWDRVTVFSTSPNAACDEPAALARFYLARDAGASDFGSSYPSSDPRDVMNPVTPCP